MVAIRQLRTNEILSDRQAEAILRNKHASDNELERVAYKYKNDARSIYMQKVKNRRRG